MKTGSNRHKKAQEAQKADVMRCDAKTSARTQHVATAPKNACHPERSGESWAEPKDLQFPRVLERSGCANLSGNISKDSYLLACLVLTLLTITSLAQSPTTTLTLPQAEDLATKRKGTLPLNDLKSIPVEIATALAKQEGELILDGLTTLTPEAAAALANHRPSTRFGVADLSLGGLTTLSPELAAALAKHQGALAMKSLTTLDSAPLARKLAAQWGELALDGLTSLTPEIATILAESQGTLVDLTRPGVQQRRADRAPSVLRFDNLTTLSVETAAALAKQKGVLVLSGLTTLSPEVAAALAPHEGTLVLNGITTLSPEAATALAASPSELVLRAVTTLLDPAAQALAGHKNRLYLPALTAASPAARLALREHPKIRLPAGF